MSTVRSLVDKLSQFGDWTGEKAGSLIGYIREKTGNGIADQVNAELDKLLDLPPIKISLLAPMGAGKTSLITTVRAYLRHELNKPNGFSIVFAPSDASVLDAYYNELNNRVKAGQPKFDTGAILPGAVPRNFSFEIRFDYGDGHVLAQPFIIKDIPGGWLDDTAAVKYEDWKAFEDHLYDSRILWIPVDAPKIMEIKDDDNVDKRKFAIALLRLGPIEELCNDWAKARLNKKVDEQWAVQFIPMKCETYTAQSSSQSSSDIKSEELFGKVRDRYVTCIKNIRTLCPSSTQIYMEYVPVESIGVIRLIDAEWTESGLDTEYALNGNSLEIHGAEALVRIMLEYASGQIRAMYKKDYDMYYKLLHEKNLFKKIKNTVTGKTATWKEIMEQYLKPIEKMVMPLSEEMSRIASLANSYKYKKVLN